MKRAIPVIRILTILTTILFLFLTAIRFLLSPLFLAIEYRMPGFPPDPYGFTFDERMGWAQVSLAYLITDQDITYLESQEIYPGQPLYNERELQHMLDVKVLVRQAIITWYIAIALLILLGLFSTEYKFSYQFWSALSKGGLWTIGIIVAILLGVLLNFDYLFTQFHRVFFQGDSWLFSYSDSLIRLFPLRFWQDAFVMLGVFASAGGLILFFVGRHFFNKKSPVEP